MRAPSHALPSRPAARRPLLAAAALAAAAALLAPACGGQGNDPPALAGPDAGAAADTGTGADGDAAVEPGPDASAPVEGPDAAVPTGPISPAKRLLVVTTSAVVSGSQKLSVSAEAKRRRGMEVAIATEADYGSPPTEKGRPRALRIREWLRTQYRSFGYLLLVGDPSTEYGDVPMLKVRPRDDLDNACGGMDCETSGTDAFYANPHGDWDLDGDGQFAEWGVDDGPGGVDLYPELIVGRLPVYFGDTYELDRTLEHLLAYMEADPAQLDYRMRALFAMSFVFFKGQVFFPNTPAIEDNVDTAPSAEWFINKYLPPERGVGYTRLYEREGHVTSAYPSEGALTEDNLVEEWKRGYGMIWWGGHGSPTSVARTVWTEDANHNDAADGDELQSKTLIRTEDSEFLAGTPGGFVVASSCLVGRIEVPYSLSYSLIRHGAAVGVIASSAPASIDGAAFEAMGPVLARDRFDLDRVAVLLFDGLIRGHTAGEMMGRARFDLGPENDIDNFQAKLMVNFYGDPTLGLYDSAADARW